MSVLTAEQTAMLLAREVPPWLLLRRAESDAQARGLTVDEALRLWLELIESAPLGDPIIVMAPTIQAALESPARDVGIFGPVGTGKSRQVCSYVYAHCVKYAAEFPGKMIRWLFVRDTFEAIRKSTLETWFSAIPAKAGLYNKNEKTFSLRLPKNQKAECLFWGLDDDKDVNKLPSLELSGVVIEEPAGGMDEDGLPTRSVDETIFHNLLPRLRQPRGLTRTRRILVGNPPTTAHWCYDLKAADDNRIVFVDVPRDESPMPASYYDDMEHEYTRRFGPDSTYVKRYVRGEWLPGLRGQMRPEDIKSIRREDLPPLRAVGATCDPATGRGADRSVIAICGFSDGGMAYLLDLRLSSEWGSAELQEEIFLAQERSMRWAYPRIGAFGIEAVGFQVWLAHNIETEQRRRGTYVPVHQLMRDTKIKKETRIMNALGARLAQKRLVVVDDCPNLDELWREMRRFDPKKDKNQDDVLDALADMDQIELIAIPASAMQSAPAVAHQDDGAPNTRHARLNFHADRRGLLAGSYGTRRLQRIA